MATSGSFFFLFYSFLGSPLAMANLTSMLKWSCPKHSRWVRNMVFILTKPNQLLLLKHYKVFHWLYHVGRDLRVVYEIGQSLIANHKRSCMMLVTHSTSGVQLQVSIDGKVIFKMNQFLVMVGHPNQKWPCVQDNTMAEHSCN